MSPEPLSTGSPPKVAPARPANVFPLSSPRVSRPSAAGVLAPIFRAVLWAGLWGVLAGAATYGAAFALLSNYYSFEGLVFIPQATDPTILPVEAAGGGGGSILSRLQKGAGGSSAGLGTPTTIHNWIDFQYIKIPFRYVNDVYLSTSALMSSQSLIHLEVHGKQIEEAKRMFQEIAKEISDRVDQENKIISSRIAQQEELINTQIKFLDDVQEKIRASITDVGYVPQLVEQLNKVLAEKSFLLTKLTSLKAYQSADYLRPAQVLSTRSNLDKPVRPRKGLLAAAVALAVMLLVLAFEYELATRRSTASEPPL